MNAITGFFYVFATILVFASLRVVTARNPVHSALYLVLAFFSASALWMLLEAEFLAISLVLVYVGAVMVLFLFVVMMVDLNMDKIRAGFWKNLPVATIVGSLIAFQMSVILLRGFWDPQAAVAPAQPQDNTLALGKLLFTEYLYPFEVAALILLVAMVAAIALTLRKRKDTKSQTPSEQVRVKSRDRLKIVSMAADVDRKQTKSGQ
jgi:NADH-quinone oxidoreductase subunit J